MDRYSLASSKFQIMFLELHDISKLCLNINGLLLSSSKQVKLLGVNIDNSLNVELILKSYAGRSIESSCICKVTTVLGEQKYELLLSSVVMSNFSYYPLI